jgi:hypothetical protein
MPEDNPYQSPLQHDPTPRRPSALAVVMGVTLGVLAFPAGVVAMYVTCTGVVGVWGFDSIFFAVFAGLVVGGAVIGGIFYLCHRLDNAPQRTYRRPPRRE